MRRKSFREYPHWPIYCKTSPFANSPPPPSDDLCGLPLAERLNIARHICSCYSFLLEGSLPSTHDRCHAISRCSTQLVVLALTSLATVGEKCPTNL